MWQLPKMFISYFKKCKCWKKESYKWTNKKRTLINMIKDRGDHHLIVIFYIIFNYLCVAEMSISSFSPHYILYWCGVIWIFFLWNLAQRAEDVVFNHTWFLSSHWTISNSVHTATMSSIKHVTHPRL